MPPLLRERSYSRFRGLGTADDPLVGKKWKLSLSLSLKRVYLYRKLIILNEKNKSALNG
jgi:hypothetical protein